MSTSQLSQDIFVRWALNNKHGGYFLEIGACHPIFDNNTFLLEKDYNWTGLMIEIDPTYAPMYSLYRARSRYLIADAQEVDYIQALSGYPMDMDYLQVDAEVENQSTLNILRRLETSVLDRYKFATITFEHDINRGDYFNTREISRKVFSKFGYIRVFGDVCCAGKAVEDWYVNPSLVDASRYGSFVGSDGVEHSVIASWLLRQN